MYTVLKRDGKIVDFDLTKISEAISMAFDAQERNYNQNVIDFLALKVTADFEPKIKDGHIAVEDIQDSVESVLIQAGYDDVAKAYILYRRQRAKLREVKSTVLDYKSIVDSYVKVTDWRVKENSTVTYSVGGLIPTTRAQSPLTTGSPRFMTTRLPTRTETQIYIFTTSRCLPATVQAGP